MREEALSLLINPILIWNIINDTAPPERWGGWVRGGLEFLISDFQPVVSVVPVTHRCASLPCGRGSLRSHSDGIALILSLWHSPGLCAMGSAPSLAGPTADCAKCHRPAWVAVLDYRRRHHYRHHHHHYYYWDLKYFLVSLELWLAIRIPGKSAPSSPSSPMACRGASSETSSRGLRRRASNSSAWSWCRWVGNVCLTNAARPPTLGSHFRNGSDQFTVDH